MATSAGTSAWARNERARGVDGCSDGREHGERVEWPSGVGEHHRLVEEQLLLADGIADAITRQPVHRQRLVGAEQPPHQVAGADLDDVSEERIVVGRDRRSRGQHLLRLDVRPDLVQRLTEQQADLRRHAIVEAPPAPSRSTVAKSCP